jgi:hypothetical protein
MKHMSKEGKEQGSICLVIMPSTMSSVSPYLHYMLIHDALKLPSCGIAQPITKVPLPLFCVCDDLRHYSISLCWCMSLLLPA